MLLNSGAYLAYLTFERWYVGLQLNGSIQTGKVSFMLSQLLHFKEIELPEDYEYSGNGRGGKHKEFDIEIDPSDVFKEMEILINKVNNIPKSNLANILVNN